MIGRDIVVFEYPKQNERNFGLFSVVTLFVFFGNTYK